MPLWSNTDANTSAPKFAVAGGLGVAQSGEELYGSNTAGEFVENLAVGVFGVDNAETTVNKAVTHPGWILRTEGTGGRAGRVFHETIVAMGSMTSDGEDDVQYPDAIITITTQPQNTSNTAGGNASFTVGATVVPAYAPLSYQWFLEDVGGDIELSGQTGTTLSLQGVATENVYYAVVTSGDVTVQSANATLSIDE